MSDSYDLLRAQRFLDGLNDWQLQRLAQHAQRSMFHAGNRVFREGDPADRMWLIVAGRVAVDTHLPGHGEVIVDTLGPGAVLGWSWLVPPHRWRFGAVAIETTHTVEMDGPSVRQLCHSDPCSASSWRWASSRWSPSGSAPPGSGWPAHDVRRPPTSLPTAGGPRAHTPRGHP